MSDLLSSNTNNITMDTNTTKGGYNENNHDNDNNSSNILKNGIINNYKNITHEYQISVKSNQILKKKIKYNNPDDYDKIINIYTNEPYITIKENSFSLEYKSSKYIRLKFQMPKSLGTYIAYIYIENKLPSKSEIEEVLKFIIDVNE